MDINLRYAESEEESCGECRHFFCMFVNKVYLGKIPCNGWCNVDRKDPTYTANNLVCDNFKSFFDDK